MNARAPRGSARDEVVALVEAVRRDPARRNELVEVLRDSHPTHRGLGAADVVRLRAYVMHVFGEVGLPDEALPFVLEDLETSDHADAVVAAARAVRGWQAAPALGPILERAAANIRGRDAYVTFTSLDAVGAPGAGTTAAQELAATTRWLQANLDCCATLPPAAKHLAPASRPAPPLDLALEDQHGARVSFADFFLGRPSVVAFFYTRCENPQKCSLTVTKLARLQSRLPDTPIAALTYDPAFDTPARLLAYGLARGFAPSPRHRLLRAAADPAPLEGFFANQVSRTSSTVTRHRPELFVLDASARLATTFTHRDWPEDAVVEAVTRALRTDR